MSRVYKNKIEPHKSTPGEFDIPFEEVNIPTKNHRSLYGWWIKGKIPDSPTIILVHGWNRNVGRMMPYIKELYPKDYNLLAFDSRNHGSSDKDNFSSMLKFAEDINASIDFLKLKLGVKNSNIGIIGLSIGGGASIYASANNPKIKSVITVGALASPMEVMKSEISKRIKFWPLVWIVLKYARFRIGISFEKLAPINNIGNSNSKILLIHGTNDLTIPYNDAVRLCNAGKPDQVELWTLEGKSHSDCHEHPDYWKRILRFFDETL